VHADFRGVYGARRVHAELTPGHDIEVGRYSVELLMERTGLHGVSGPRRFRSIAGVASAADRVDGQFAREDPIISG
jgi:putative transposase